MVRNILFLSCVFVICPIHTTRAGLIASWSGNGTANDSTGAHNGTLVNGAGYGTGSGGQQAFLFNGLNQYMSAPASTDFAFGSTPFSIELLANFSVIHTGAITSLPNVFIGNDEGPGNQNKWVFFYDGNGHLVFHINSPASGPIFLSSPSTFNPVLGVFYDFQVTESGGSYTFFENGNSLGTVFNATSVPYPNALLTIGEAENLGYFNGLIQDVQINTGTTAVPEPSSALLASIGGIALVAFRSWKKRHGER